MELSSREEFSLRRQKSLEDASEAILNLLASLSLDLSLLGDLLLPSRMIASFLLMEIEIFKYINYSMYLWQLSF